ncbi:hypothetical protein KAI52_03970 [Candidatus Parcubacteria bacterium]|nr:hypothetical protein [Candidatus Parcubacteria bacterium]
MKKSHEKKTDELNNRQRKKMLWASVILISGIIFLGWMYNFITSTNIRISNQQEKEQLPQITDFKKQLQGMKNQLKEFNLKNATGSYTETKNIQEGFDATTTNANNFNAK